MQRRHDYSQHFLRDPKLVRELLKRTAILPGSTVIDIGAGSGVITSVLAEYGCSVIAVELEERTAQILRKNTASYSNITIVESDFLTFTLPKTPYGVFANIPFHLSAEIIRKIADTPTPPQAAYCIVQKQFADRLLPDFDGPSSQLGMMIGPSFSVRAIHHLKRTDFIPHPNVDTVLLEILPREKPLIATAKLPTYRKFIQRAFSDPAYFATLATPRRAFNPGVTASQLSLSEWILLFTTK